MDDYIELDVERDAVARALGVVPGVAVAGDDAGEGSVGDDDADDDGPEATPVPGAAPGDTADEADGGATAKLGALWRQWGLLGTGVTLVALGAGLVGLWLYRRRSADGSAAEEATEEWDEWTPSETMDSPPPSVDTPSPTGSADGVAGTDAGDTEDGPAPEPQQTALGEEAARSERGDDIPVRGRREDREDVDWSVREDRTPGDATESSQAGAGTDETTETETDASAEDEREDLPGASIDPAPLLGAAFLIATSALGRWARREHETGPGQ
ncbi:hypothetical protein [Haloarcula salina]|uniref:Uncharacterized protein n=1 Tax=Haloarcula salina TaxID=1429914 RepID=A0AA41FXL8_9EURY|nr:hypothetical protein [Haloarcula salina]MBV0900680.1 hypothetical protein [Haloarcula salina]